MWPGGRLVSGEYPTVPGKIPGHISPRVPKKNLHPALFPGRGNGGAVPPPCLLPQPPYSTGVIQGSGIISPGFSGHTKSPPAILHDPACMADRISLWELVCHYTRIPRPNTSMKKPSIKPEIAGTRSGYVIRYTCPVCNAENSIVNKTPRDHYNVSRDAACPHCKKQCAVITPAMTQSRGYSPVVLPVRLPVTK